MKQLLGISDKYIVFLDEKTKVGSNGLVSVCPVKWILRPAILLLYFPLNDFLMYCLLLPSSNILLSCSLLK